jgi:hypothetical protein
MLRASRDRLTDHMPGAAKVLPRSLGSLLRVTQWWGSFNPIQNHRHGSFTGGERMPESPRKWLSACENAAILVIILLILVYITKLVVII